MSCVLFWVRRLVHRVRFGSAELRNAAPGEEISTHVTIKKYAERGNKDRGSLDRRVETKHCHQHKTCTMYKDEPTATDIETPSHGPWLFGTCRRHWLRLTTPQTLLLGRARGSQSS